MEVLGRGSGVEGTWIEGCRGGCDGMGGGWEKLKKKRKYYLVKNRDINAKEIVLRQ